MLLSDTMLSKTYHQMTIEVWTLFECGLFVLYVNSLSRKMYYSSYIHSLNKYNFMRGN